MTNIVLMVELTKNSGIFVILAIAAFIALSVFLSKNKEDEEPLIDVPETRRPIHTTAEILIEQIDSCLTYEQLLSIESRFRTELDYYAGHKNYKVFYAEVSKVLEQKRFSFTN